jgi:MFS family permease
MKENKIGYREILRQKEYMKTVIAAMINRFGDSIDGIAFTWLVYQITRSAAWSAIIFGVNRVPTILLQPFAGAVVEGKNKKRIMIVTDIIRGICVGIVSTAYLAGFLNQWILLTCTIVISCAEAFRNPASSALLPKLLDKKLYSFGISLNTSLCSVTELIGLGVSGVIISVLSISTAIYIDMITFFLSALIILTLRIKEEQLTKVKINANEYIDNLKGGVLYLKGKVFLRYMITIAISLNAILVPLNSLQAPLVSEVLHSNEIMLSVLGLGITLGMILGAVLYPYISMIISRRAILCVSGYTIAGYYLSIVGIGQLIHSDLLKYIIVAVSSLLLGAAIAILNTFAGVEFMKAIEESYLARVTSIMNASAVAALPIVSFIVSILTGFLTTKEIIFSFGILGFIICIIIYGRKRFAAMEIKRIEGGENEGTLTDSEAC